MEPTEPVRVSRKLKAIQALMGFSAWLFLALPYGKRTTGLEKLDNNRRYLFVSNHVSLLDTILLGALLWRSGNYPILVLGDKNVWSTSWIKSALSRPIGFLLERGRLNPNRINELQKYAQLGRRFNLVVFPEGTRGNGVTVAECQPGIYYVAQESRAVIVPVFIENMQFVSTKLGAFHPISGLRKIETHFGEPVLPEEYAGLSREEFTEFVRRKIEGTRPG
ncbi:MAG TPA: lysophospholipid acyltransferase family protein [Verrucomicrobiae bacterium]|nr:lysophospholipid acyltransferase family protein [Verrucomicrobiae bacterium]